MLTNNQPRPLTVDVWLNGSVLSQILYKHGRLQMFRSGTDLAIRKTKSLYVVTSGLLKVSYSDPQDNTQEYFLASGASNLCSSSHPTLLSAAEAVKVLCAGGLRAGGIARFAYGVDCTGTVLHALCGLMR